MAQSYKVGEAPWEKEQSKSFKVGEAPWEKPQVNQTVTLGEAPQEEDISTSGFAQGVQKFFPGAKLGEALGNSMEGISALAQGDTERASAMGKANMDMMPRVFADVGNAMYTAASPLITPFKNVPGIAGAASRIGSNAAMGAGSGTASAYASGMDTGDSLRNGGIVGLLSGGLSGIGEGVRALTKAAPKAILNTVKGIDDPDQVLPHLKYGGREKLVEGYADDVAKYGQQITDEVGPKTPWGSVTGDYDGMGVVHKTIADNADAHVTPVELIEKMKKLIPERTEQLRRLANGHATLFDKSEIRKALNVVNEKAYERGELAGTAAKRLAQSFNKNLSGELRSVIGDEILDNQGAAIQLKKALENKPSTRNIMRNVGGLGGALLGGLGGGGMVGGAGGMVMGGAAGSQLDALASSPAVRLNLAKGAQDLSKTTKFADIMRGARPYLQSLLGKLE